MVEVACGIVPAYQCRGFGTEGAEALTAYAFASGRVRVVCTHTRPELNATTTILVERVFERVGEVVDPEDGLAWRWEWYEEQG